MPVELRQLEENLKAGLDVLHICSRVTHKFNEELGCCEGSNLK